MIEKITYIANDGKEFDDEFSCVKHEIKLMPNNLILLDKDLNKVDLDKNNFLDDSYDYIFIQKDEDLKYTEALYNYSGLPFPDEIGMYHYNYESQRWVKIEEEILILNNLLNKEVQLNKEWVEREIKLQDAKEQLETAVSNLEKQLKKEIRNLSKALEIFKGEQ